MFIDNTLLSASCLLFKTFSLSAFFCTVECYTFSLVFATFPFYKKHVRATVANGATATTDFAHDFVITASDTTPTITGVTVSPATQSVQQGATQQFTATVQGTNSPPQTVAWAVSGNAVAGTTINASGLLTVAANETATSLTITATSTFNIGISDTANVTVTTAPPTTFTVTFNLNNDTRTGGGALLQTIQANNPATIPTVSRDNHSFNGWTSSVAGMTPANITGNVTFTAQWIYTGTPSTGNGGGNDSWTDNRTHARNPQITSQPQSATVNINETATLSVTATSPDNGTLTYQWQRATEANGGVFRDIPNATDHTFTPDTTTAGVNRYRVVITNTNNASWVDGNRTARINSHVATVTVNTQAIVTDPPLVDDVPPTTDPNINYNPPTGGEPTQPLPFADVNPNDWFYPFVRAVWEQRLFNGVSPTAFHPQSSMTRAMFVQMLANMEGINTNAYQTSNSQSPRFYDTNSTAWYFGAVEWAASQGLVYGIGGGNFAPSRAITRQEMAVMLHNYIVFRGIELPNGATGIFTDQDNISAWALEGVMAIQAAGIITGYPDGSFQPQGTAARAEVAIIFARFLEVADLPRREQTGTQPDTDMDMLPVREDETDGETDNELDSDTSE